MTFEPDDISRRDFVTRTATAVAGVALGGGAAAAAAQTAPAVGNRILGANDRVVVASIGIRSQGNGLKRGFAKLENVEVKTLCDVDENLFASRANDPALADCSPTSSPATSRTSAACSTTRTSTPWWWPRPTTGTRWPRIWAIQAGKHVYVEKPASPHGVGRPADGRGGPQAQQDRAGRDQEPQRGPPCGRRSSSSTRAGWARSTWRAGSATSRARTSASYPDGPHGAGRDVPASTPRPGPTSPPTTRPICRRWTTTCGWARRPSAPVQPEPLPLQLALALGLRQRRHRQPGPASVRHRALGPRQGRAPGEDLVRRRPVRRRATAPRRRRTSTPRCSPTPTGRSSSSRRAGTYSNDEGTQRIGNLFYGSKGWLWIDGDGRVVAVLPRPQGREGPRRKPAAGGRTPRPPTLPRPARSIRTSRTSWTRSAPATARS